MLNSSSQSSEILLLFEKIRLDISCELSDRQTIHIKCQALFIKKNNKTKLFYVNCLLGRQFT